MVIRLLLPFLLVISFPLASFAQLPDLSIGSFQVSPTVGPAGGNVNLTFTIQNSGKRDAGPFYTAIYFSEDTTLDPNTDTVLKEYLINNLQVGRSTVQRIRVKIPKNATLNKTSYIFVRTDSKNAINESNETNNTTSVTFSVKPGPDITIKSISLTPNPGITRNSIKISIEYSNIGRADSRPFDLEIFLSPDTILDSGDQRLRTSRINTLYKGETKVLSFYYYIPAGKVGTFYIIAVADKKDEVPEEDEDNNSKQQKAVFLESKKPDIAVEQLQIIDPKKRLGETLYLKFLAKNIGQKSAYTSFSVYYSRHPQFLPGYNWSTSSWGWRRTIPAGGSQWITVSFNIPWNKPYNIIRDYYIQVRASTFYNEPEITTANNSTNVVIFRPLPPLSKLEISGISLKKFKTNSFPCNVILNSSGKVVFPDTFTLSFSVRNNGYRSSSPVKINFYLSQDTNISKSDLLVASYTIPSLPPQFTYSRTVIKFRFTGTIPAGNYYFGALLDPDNQRQNDYGNGRTQYYIWYRFPRTFSPQRPDWKITSFAVNPSQRAVTGSQIKVSMSASQINQNFKGCKYPFAVNLIVGFWPEKNMKRGPIFSWSTYFYTANRNFSNITLSVPTGIPSINGYLGAFIDSDDKFQESDEKNNVHLVPYKIVINSHDFRIKSLKLDSTPLVWEKDHRIYFTIENIGVLNTYAYFYVRFFLSEDSKLSNNDVYLGSSWISYRGRDVGSYFSFRTQRWREGNYFIIVQVNSDRRVRESDYNNNISTLSVKVRKFKVDFQSSKVSINPKIVRAGKNNTITVDVLNAGPDKHIAQTSVCLYFSDDNVFHTDDTRVACWPTSNIYDKTGQIKFNFKGTRTLVAGQRFFIIQLDSGITGPYGWGRRWRPFRTYAEINEKNNLIIVPVEVKNDVDVTPSFLAASKTTLKIGETVVFRFKVKNVGSIPTNIPFQAWPVFSEDIKLDSSDRVIRKITVPNLDAGRESPDFYISFAIDKKINPGERYIGVLVDPNNAVKEADETNNIGYIMLNILIPGIDLQVRSGRLDKNVIPAGKSSTVKVYSEFQNFGTVTSPPFEIGFYLSRDDKLDPSDTLLAVRNYSKPLPSTAKTGQFVDTLSVNLKSFARAFILVAADHKNQIPEPIENNNILAIPIRTTNKSPKITSLPITKAVEKQTYTYQLKGYDPDGDPLTWRLLEAPIGMSLDPKSAVLSWTPQNYQSGTKFQVKIELSDGRGGIDVQVFDISVRAVNDPPAIVSIPPKFALAGQLYSYGARAFDPDRGELLQWGIISGPTGMTIDRNTGLLRWLVPQSMGGKKVDVEIRVRDKSGAADNQKFTVQIRAKNTPPRIVSKPPTDTTPGNTLSYQPRAVDPDPGEKLQWRRIAGPTNLTVDPDTGLLKWSVPSDLAGVQIGISIEVRDRFGAFDRQDFIVLIKNINHPPKITSKPPTKAQIGIAWNYRPTAIDPDVGDILTWSLERGPAGVKFDPKTGTINWLPTNGYYRKTVQFKISVSDGRGGRDTQQFSVLISRRCRLDSDCTKGEICSGGECSASGCFLGKCSDPTRPICDIDGKCIEDPCKNISCGSGQFCRNGRCIGVCAGVKCPAGEICIDGKCTTDRCYQINCPAGSTCKEGKCIKDYCSYGSCLYGRICIDGECRPDPCKYIKCPKNSRCLKGQCVNLSCQIDADCPGDEVCENGRCTPPGCLKGRPCPKGELCYRLSCQADPCKGISCKQGEFCRNGKCVSTCAGISCNKGERCRDGNCIADPCMGISCKSGEICLESSKMCQLNRCDGDNPCKYGRICHQNRCISDPCELISCPKSQRCRYGQCISPPQCSVDAECPGSKICVKGRCTEAFCNDTSPCPTGKLCFDGECRDDRCKGITCPKGQYCRAGKCVSSCAGIFCPEGERCRDGQCISNPCFGIKCKGGEVCKNGKCVRDICQKYKKPCKYSRLCTAGGCIDNRCKGIVCPANQKCDPLTGQCFGSLKCKVDSQCPKGGICRGGYCAPAGCYKKNCPKGKSCFDGFCKKDRCKELQCPAGQYCKDGICKRVCTCPPGMICTEKGCEPDRCSQMSCDENNSCYRGNCRESCPQDACRYGRICKPGPYCVDDPCRDIECPKGSICRDGLCTDICSTLNCPTGTACRDSKCIKLPGEKIAERETTPDSASSTNLPDTIGDMGGIANGGCGCSGISDIFPSTIILLFLLGIFLKKFWKYI